MHKSILLKKIPAKYLDEFIARQTQFIKNRVSLLCLMKTERAIGYFYYFLPDKDRGEFYARLDEYFYEVENEIKK